MENEEKVISSEAENESSKTQKPPKGEWAPKGPRPEPPKDENGNPVAPPRDGRRPRGPEGFGGKRPPMPGESGEPKTEDAEE